MTTESYKRFRPAIWTAVEGQEPIKKTLQNNIKSGKLPHFILMSGPSGTGKTTLARIVAAKMECGDISEINCAHFRGVDTIRELQRKINMAPLRGKVRFFIIDECHQLTKEAQNAFLKILEDTPPHVYFVLATTEPEKLLNTVHTRATHLKLKTLTEKEVKAVVLRVCKLTKATLSDEVMDKLTSVSDGSGRKALVLYDQIQGMDEESQLALLTADIGPEAVIGLCRELLNSKPSWSKIQALLKGITEEPESVRRAVLGYASGIMGGSKNQKLMSRAFILVDSFGSNYYDNGKAGLYASCWEATFGIE